ncbi:conserved exported hypothetical protein [[Clostridium] ultunense Esp]|nr:conserved exported hypothetical protein [[Clostridium] ultunense Esp]
MKKRGLSFGVLLACMIFLSSCSTNIGINREEHVSQSSQGISQNTVRQNLSDSQQKESSIKKLIQVTVKRGKEVFPFNDPSISDHMGIVVDIQNLLWVAQRGGIGIELETEKMESNKLDQLLNVGATLKDPFYSVRLTFEPYKPEPGSNDLPHQDLLLFTNPNQVKDAYLGVQNPDHETEWMLYRLPDFNGWLAKEVDLLLRVYTGL